MDFGYNLPNATVSVSGVLFNVPSGSPAAQARGLQVETLPKAAAQTNSGVALLKTTADGNSRLINPS